MALSMLSRKSFLFRVTFVGIITGKHLIYFEIFALDQAGNNDRIIKFEENMVRSEEDLDLFSLSPVRILLISFKVFPGTMTFVLSYSSFNTILRIAIR